MSDNEEHVLVDCGHMPWTSMVAIIGYDAVLFVGAVVASLFLPRPPGGVLIAAAVFTMVVLAFNVRPRSTRITTRGVFGPAGGANWGDIVDWELYNEGKALTLLTRSELLRVDALTLEVLLFKNQTEAERVLRERVPNGRVLP